MALKVPLNGTCVAASEAPRGAASEDVLGDVGLPDLSQPKAKAAVMSAAAEIFGILGCIMAVAPAAPRLRTRWGSRRSRAAVSSADFGSSRFRTSVTERADPWLCGPVTAEL